MKKTILLFALAAMTVACGCAKKPTQTADSPKEKTETRNSASTVQTVPETVDGKDVVDYIASKHKGQAVLIDFWATWCGPCRMAMKQVDEIKPELMKKGCVFVYVTGESSPLETWNKMIKNIDGEHYRLTKQQWEGLCTSLGIPGIPAYLLLDKNGERLYDNLSEGGYPGSEILRNNIEVALTGN